MSEQVGFGKRNQLVDDLAGQIHSGRLVSGERLPGENQLAKRYQVSRGTVRSALSELQRRELIATQTGVGSFVTFDGVALDQVVGWAQALAQTGSGVSTELIAIEHYEDAELSESLGVDRFIAVRRLRRDDTGTPVSFENAYVPGDGELADLPERGLVDGSLTATMLAAGLRVASGEQWITVEYLEGDSARLLERPEGTPFLHATRTSLDAKGNLCEYVVSLLDPARFQFHLAFGQP